MQPTAPHRQRGPRARSHPVPGCSQPRTHQRRGRSRVQMSVVPPGCTHRSQFSLLSCRWLPRSGRKRLDASASSSLSSSCRCSSLMAERMRRRSARSSVASSWEDRAGLGAVLPPGLPTRRTMGLSVLLGPRARRTLPGTVGPTQGRAGHPPPPSRDRDSLALAWDGTHEAENAGRELGTIAGTMHSKEMGRMAPISGLWVSPLPSHASSTGASPSTPHSSTEAAQTPLT